MKKRAFDVFISHASEDKEAFAEPLANELQKRGLKVWFDKFELKVGDSLRQSIEGGLASSRFGVIVYSANFFKKKWTRAELNGLFAQEISGTKKRILPVLHNVSIAELRKRHPIQADKYSLSSAMPISELCDALIGVISPDLLKLEILRKRSFDSSDTFVQAAKAEYPGYEFSVHTNVFKDGEPASGKSGGKRIEMRVVDPSVMKSPPTINVTFVGEGAVKADEFLRTGKAQTWNVGEFAKFESNAPFFPRSVENSVFSVDPVIDSKPRPVRVEIGDTPEVCFGLMTLSISRRGLEEGELQIRDDAEPLSFAIVTSFTGSKEFNLSLSWKFSGHTAQRCQRAIEAVDQIMQGALIRIIDLREEMRTIELPTKKAGDGNDPFDKESRRLFSLCSQIERYFKVQITMGTEISEREAETLRVLDCLLNGTTFGEGFSTEFKMVKGACAQLVAQLLVLQGEEFNASSEVRDYAGYFEIFACKIPTATWGINTRCVFDIAESERQSFREAEEGFVLSCKAISSGPTKLVWMKENE
jgi:hypothetical protein